MKRSIAIVTMLMMLTACTGLTPAKNWANQRDALTAASVAFKTASDANKLSDEQRVYYGELLQSARKSLAKAEALLPNGGSTFDSYMAIVQAVLVKAAEPQVR